MNTTRSVAALHTPLLLSAGFAGCGRINTSTSVDSPTPASSSITPAGAPTMTPAVSPTATVVAQNRDMGPIQFAPGGTSATLSNFVTSNSVDRYTFDASAGQPPPM